MELQGLNANRCSIGEHFYTTTLRKLCLKQGKDQVKPADLTLSGQLYVNKSALPYMNEGGAFYQV